MTTETMHIGKQTEEVKTSITPELLDHIASLASKLRCTPSDLYRDAIYLAFTGATHSAHVANCRMRFMHAEGRESADKPAS